MLGFRRSRCACPRPLPPGSGQEAETIEVECFCHSQNFLELPHDKRGASCGFERSALRITPKLPSAAVSREYDGVSQGGLGWCADTVTGSRAWRFCEQFSLKKKKKKEGECLCFSFHVALGEKASVPLVCCSHPPCPPPAHHLLTVAAGPRHSQHEQNLHKQTNL